MLYVFSGNQEAYRAFIESLKEKHSFSSAYFASASELTPSFLDEMSQDTLFGDRYLAAIDGLTKALEFSNMLIERVDALKVSTHAIVLFDEDESLIDFAEEHKILVAPKAKKEGEVRGVNPFTISDSIFSRDKKSSWITFHSLLGEGLAPREIHMVLFWAFKAIAQAAKAKSADESGLKPFVFSKAKKGSWKDTEIENGLSSLAHMLHTTSFDDEDFSFALERFILKVV